MSAANCSGLSLMPRATCAVVPAAGTMPEERAVAPLGAGSRSSTNTSTPADFAASAAVAPAPPAPMTTMGTLAAKRECGSTTTLMIGSRAFQLLFDPARRGQCERILSRPRNYLHSERQPGFAARQLTRH